MNQLDTIREQWPGKLSTYVLGLFLSLFLTLAAYFLVVKDVLTNWNLIWAVIAIAALQAIVQLLFFLHLSKEEKPRWNLYVFLSMLLIMSILVFGSLWIMYNLDGRVMPSQEEMETFMLKQGQK